MQKLAEICIRRPVFAAMIVLSLVVVGAASYFKLGVDRFPSVDLPTVAVRTNLPGASPEEMETLVSQRIEEVVNTVDGIDNLRSVSVQGNSIVIATFNLNRDIDTAAQDVRDRVSTVIRNLPPDAKPPVIAKFNNDSTAVITIALSGQRSIRELTEYADKVVKVQLERAGGVGEVDVVGGLDRAINVWIDAERLAAYKIPITKVRDALQRQNADVPGGNVETDKRELVLRTLGRYTDPRQMEDLVVANINGAPVRIRDIGGVEDGTKEQRSIARLNGVPTVTLEIRRQSRSEEHTSELQSLRQLVCRLLLEKKSGLAHGLLVSIATGREVILQINKMPELPGEYMVDICGHAESTAGFTPAAWRLTNRS